MARIRTLKPEFFRSRSLAGCSREARLTFQGLWCEADDFGRGIADPRILKGAIWPLDDDITWKRVEKLLDELAASGHIRLYVSGGELFYDIPSWEEHQAAAYRRGNAIHPEPDEHARHVQSCKEVQGALAVVLELGTRNEELGTGSTRAAARTPPPKETRVPDPFDVSDAMETWVKDRCPELDWERETEKFVNYWTASSSKTSVKRDWAAAWRTWMLDRPGYRKNGAAR